jgi:glycosyltransferase involved in cell wall biosynthesis
MKRRILFWVHDPEAPSFRHRIASHLPALESEGFSCDVEIFPRRRYGVRILERAAHLREFDLLVIAKLKLETGERQAVRRLARKIVYDFDDAVYFSKPDRLGDPPDRGRRRIRKFQATCAIADLVTAGNETLASHARPHSRRLEVVPTAIDLFRYTSRARSGSATRLVWIGLPGNLPYLDLVREPLAALRREHPGLSLRVVSERPPEDFPIPVDFVRWSEESEAADLAAADVGVMPLTDDDWTRGKGGFKLLQYMAAGLPCVASPVGVNREIVIDGTTGFLAADDSEWESALRSLLADPAQAKRMGEAGRRRVEERYEKSIVSRRLVELYRSVAIPGGS